MFAVSIDSEQNAPSSYAGHDTLIIPLTRKQNNEKHVRNIWEKVHRMWSKVYSTPELLYNFGNDIRSVIHIVFVNLYDNTHFVDRVLYQGG